MASTVIIAFEQFMREQVNLDPAVSASARTSRDWLLGQLHLLPENHFGFPPLWNEKDIHYGSFARRTKIRELDDIDLIVGMQANGTTYSESGASIHLHVPDGISLRELCHEATNLLNSRRVINKFVKHLGDVPQYDKADIGRNDVAAVLSLKSYTWSFDIVPGFFTTPEADNRTFYIIPDGNGHWMKTDPRIDQERVTVLNQKSDGHLLEIVRLVKYWNRRQTAPTMPAYLLECIVLDYYSHPTRTACEFVDIEIGPLLAHIGSSILSPVPDPKGIQGDINSVTIVDRSAIYTRAHSDSAKALLARAAETADDHSGSIGIWREVLGPMFPSFT